MLFLFLIWIFKCDYWFPSWADDYRGTKFVLLVALVHRIVPRQFRAPWITEQISVTLSENIGEELFLLGSIHIVEANLFRLPFLLLEGLVVIQEN
jgi:hypothetical protein